MRVLWLSCTPGNSAKRISNKVLGGGWLVSLENEIKKDPRIELSIAYMCDKPESPFVFEGVHYYPVCPIKYDIYGVLGPIIKRATPDRLYDKKSISLILDVINMVNPDIIHIHGTEGSWGVCTPYVKNIPIVFSIQGLIAPYKEKMFSGLQYRDVRRVESLLTRMKFDGIKAVRSKFGYRALRELCYLSHSHYIIGRTDWDNRVTLALNPSRKYYVVNEILRDAFYNRIWHRDSNSCYRIISTISDGVYKGYETVLKTAKLLKSISFNFEWIVIGYDNNNKWKDICEKITNIKPESVNIQMVGRLDAEAIASYLENSDVYCHVSHIENSPNSVCEAMIIGTPVIATFAGGTNSLLTDNQEGILLQDGDPYSLAGAIVDLSNNPHKARIFSQNARNRAIARHNQNRIKGELIEAYDQIIKDFQDDKK